MFKLDELEHRGMEELSGGERQRAVLARQLAFTPSFLLLDECTSNLGWLHVEAIEKELMRLREGGACIVLVTHNIPQAHRIADQIMVLKDGRLLRNDDDLAKSLLKGEWFTQDSTKKA